jgi:DNA topoisomerase-1
MESEFDEIAEGKLKWQPVIKDFYDPFAKNLKEKMDSVTKADLQEETDEKCPDCGNNLVIKFGRFGKFYACKNYPDCKFTKPLISEKTKQLAEKASDEKCPKCGKKMVVKEGRFGPFLACEGYPECKTTVSLSPKAEVKCPNCGGDIMMRRSKKGRTFWGCGNYPKCKTAFWNEPVDKKCEKCGNLMVKAGKDKLKCSECK